MSSKRRVALIIETSSSYGRGLLAGIVRFRRTNHDWSIFLEQRDLRTRIPAWLDTWKGNGIISRATSRQMVKALAATGVPLVDLTDRGRGYGFPSVRSDDAAIGLLAANHLMERGFRVFGFCGFESEAWSSRRGQAFMEAVGRLGTPCIEYNSRWYGKAALSWEDEQRKIVEWLRRLVKPVGIFASNDIRAQHVLEACSRAKLTVPEEVAVLGVDDDELLCQLCNPPLSSVIPNTEMIGYKAAELLSELMAKRKLKARECVVEPIGIRMRLSTDVVAIDDREVAAALSYIREHACSGITVKDVLDNVPVSRSTLERHLRKYLGRTPQQEIRNVQLKRARELLASTDLPIERIAHLCGFEHSEYMHVVFKRELQTTPGRFRMSAKP